MINCISLRNYRNLHLENGLSFDPLTVFVGSNGSGKTNLIRVLRFLQEAWINAEDERRGISRFENALSRLGSGRILDKSLDAPSEVNMQVCFSLQKGYKHGYNLVLQVNDENSVSIRQESMRRWKNDKNFDEAFKYYDINLASQKNFVSKFWEDDNTNNPSSLKKPITHFIKADDLPSNELGVHSLQKWLEENSDNPTKDTPFFEGKRRIEEYIREWSFYDASQMNIEVIRKASPEIGLGDRILTPSGDNLALVLFNLSRDSIDFEEKLRQAMSQLFPETRSVRANVIGRVALTVEWYLHGIPKPFYLDEMSEGTVRMLCWAAVLFLPRYPA